MTFNNQLKLLYYFQIMSISGLERPPLSFRSQVRRSSSFRLFSNENQLCPLVHEWIRSFSFRLKLSGRSFSEGRIRSVHSTYHVLSQSSHSNAIGFCFRHSLKTIRSLCSREGFRWTRDMRYWISLQQNDSFT